MRKYVSLALAFGLVTFLGCGKAGDGNNNPTAATTTENTQGQYTQYTSVANCGETGFDTSINPGQLYDTHVFHFGGPYIGIRVTEVIGSPRIQILSQDIPGTNLSKEQVEGWLAAPGNLVWEAQVSQETTVYPKDIPPGRYYINVFEAPAAAWVQNCAGPATE